MNRKLWALGIGLALACSQSFAWMALASGDGNGTSLYYGADTAEEAREGALKLCRKTRTGCKVGDAVNGTAMVVAKGAGGWGNAADPSPEKAEARALKNCREVATNCKVVQALWDPGFVWSALAVGGNTPYLRVNESTKEAAEADALAGCRKGDQPQECAIEPSFTRSTRTHYARAVAADRMAYGYGFGPTEKEAKQSAMGRCAEHASAGTRCTVDTHYLNETEQPAPKGMARLAALAERNLAAASAPPPATKRTVATTTSTNVLRCSNQCVNGNCLRTFENGRKERWTAPRKFNPFTNNWEWDTTTNACGG